MEWTYCQPIKIIFGSYKINSIYDILKELNLKNGLLICDPVFTANGLAKKVLENSKGLFVEIFSDITPNPTVLVTFQKCTV